MRRTPRIGQLAAGNRAMQHGAGNLVVNTGAGNAAAQRSLALQFQRQSPDSQPGGAPATLQRQIVYAGYKSTDGWVTWANSWKEGAEALWSQLTALYDDLVGAGQDLDDVRSRLGDPTAFDGHLAVVRRYTGQEVTVRFSEATAFRKRLIDDVESTRAAVGRARRVLAEEEEARRRIEEEERARREREREAREQAEKEARRRTEEEEQARQEREREAREQAVEESRRQEAAKAAAAELKKQEAEKRRLANEELARDRERTKAENRRKQAEQEQAAAERRKLAEERRKGEEEARQAKLREKERKAAEEEQRRSEQRRVQQQAARAKAEAEAAVRREEECRRTREIEDRLAEARERLRVRRAELGGWVNAAAGDDVLGDLIRAATTEADRSASALTGRDPSADTKVVEAFGTFVRYANETHTAIAPLPAPTAPVFANAGCAGEYRGLRDEVQGALTTMTAQRARAVDSYLKRVVGYYAEIDTDLRLAHGRIAAEGGYPPQFKREAVTIFKELDTGRDAADRPRLAEQIASFKRQVERYGEYMAAKQRKEALHAAYLLTPEGRFMQAPSTAALEKLVDDGDAREGDIKDAYQAAGWDNEALDEFSVEVSIVNMPNVVVHAHCEASGVPKRGNAAHWKLANEKYDGRTYPLTNKLRDALLPMADDCRRAWRNSPNNPDRY